MVIPGVDYSYDRPGGAALAAAGKRFAVRYIAEDARGLTIPEIQDLHANSVAVAAVYEGRGGEPLLGYAQGKADASYAGTKMAALGFPIGRPCYFAIDFQVKPTLYANVAQYFRGCCDELGDALVGVYGDRFIMEHLRDLGLARWFWQAGAMSWSNYTVMPGAHMLQFVSTTLAGAAIDPNEAYQEDYGQWPAEDDMADLAEVIQMLGGMDVVRAWNAKGNIGLIQTVAAEQRARGEATNAINSRAKLIDDHIANHGAIGGIPEHEHGGVKR